MNNKIIITDMECMQYMNLLADKIKEYKKLYDTIDIKDIKNNFKENQHKYFLQWYKLNKELKEKGLMHFTSEYERELGNYLIGVVRWTDILSA